MRTLGLLVVMAAAGCGVKGVDQGQPWKTEAETAADPTTKVEGAKLLLSEEPAKARGIKEVRLDKAVKTGDEVVVIGRIGGRDKPLVKDRAMFLMVGLNMKPATECECPWDFCESDPDDLKASRALVKFVDEQGQPLGIDASKAFGIQPLSTVVVKGKLQRDGADNLTVVGTALYVKEKVFTGK